MQITAVYLNILLCVFLINIQQHFEVQTCVRTKIFSFVAVIPITSYQFSLALLKKLIKLRAMLRGIMILALA